MNEGSSLEITREKLAEKMAGDITLSESPGETMSKWRKNFAISQTALAENLNVSSSVISDYESGRRKSPGTLLVSKVINALLDIDMENGGEKIRAYGYMLHEEPLVYDICEYAKPMPLGRFCNLIDAEAVTSDSIEDSSINGYTIIDSLKAIIEMSSGEFYRLYGWSTERALIFTRVSTGKSPMVALRVTNLKPKAMVLHGLKLVDIDPMAKKIAEMERVPLLVTTMPLNEMKEILKGW